MSQSKTSSDQAFVIKPARAFSLNLKELWEYRELFYFFTWRDIKVKYKQTVLGFLWAVLQPFILMIVFTVFFNQMLKVDSAPGVPYPIFAYSGLMIWNIFATGLTTAGNSMVTNANIIKKIYFPRLIIPMSSILAAVFDFGMAFIVYIGILIYYGYMPPWDKALVLLPLSVILAILTTFGIGSFVAALNVKFRDFRYVIPFMVQLLFFLTPVIYPVNMLGEKWGKVLLAVNPMGGAIHLSRAALIDKPVDIPVVLISMATGLVFFLVGVFFFKRTEAQFADIA